MSWGRFFALSLPLALSLGLAQPWSPLASFEPLSMRNFGPSRPHLAPTLCRKGHNWARQRSRNGEIWRNGGGEMLEIENCHQTRQNCLGTACPHCLDIAWAPLRRCLDSPIGKTKPALICPSFAPAVREFVRKQKTTRRAQLAKLN